VKQLIRKLTDRWELLLVVLVAFGGTIPRGLTALLSPQSLLHGAPPITQAVLLRSILIELVILTVLALFLRARGWTIARLRIEPSIRGSLEGVGLFVGYNVLYYVLAIALASAWPTFARIVASTRLIQPGIGWPTIVAVSLVNPLFEEALLCGYLVCALKESKGITTAVNVSAGIRLFGHFYQGALGVVGIVPMGLLFAYWYARTGRLWPLLVAHALQDFAALVLTGR
jgi:uncharacterized protein